MNIVVIKFCALFVIVEIAYSTILAVFIASSPAGTHILASCSSKLLFDLDIH